MPSRTKSIGAKSMYKALELLSLNGGELPSKEVVKMVGNQVGFGKHDERARKRYEKTGYIRRESIMHFYSIDFTKAGFLRKQKGLWILTEEGERALKKFDEIELLNESVRLYKERDKEREKIDEEPEDEEDIVESNQSHKADIEQLELKALEQLRAEVLKMNPYEFQDFIGALLRAMGYFTPFVAAKGKDGGVDIVAYSDPLGAKEPRIKVQVKHRPEHAISIDEIQRMSGLLNKAGDVGIIVTSGRFTRDAEIQARNGSVHIELIDFERLVELRQQFYDKLTDEDKNKLPLHPIYFLGLNE